MKSYFPALVGLAFLWMLLTVGYIYSKFKKGWRFRHARRVIDRVQLALKREKWADVIKEAESATQVALTRPEQVFIGCAVGTALLCSGELPKAQKLQRELLAAYPDEPQVHHLTARVMLATKDFSEEAIEAYHRLLSVEPNNRELLEALNCHYQARAPESDEAAKILDRLLELDPTNPGFRYYRGLKFLRQKEFSEAARAAYTRVLEIEPTRVDMRYGLARSQFEAKNYLEAIKQAKLALDLDVRQADLHRILMMSYARLSMQAEGAKEYRQMISRHPDVPELRQYMRQLEGLKDGELAEEVVSKESEALYEKGVKLYREGKFRDAVGALSAAFNTDHLKLSAGTLLVRAYLKQREVKTALMVFERMDVLSLRQPDEFILGLCYDVAQTYLTEGKKEKAVDLYTFICRVNVSYKDAFQRLEALQTGA
ncbi:MAG: tetratricopeptide repeat protein [Candidatus Riflebacteria bacterium]|nr:tetratricopeptide repeat protein [Candidatus Riflebacteria bacterium]